MQQNLLKSDSQMTSYEQITVRTSDRSRNNKILHTFAALARKVVKRSNQSETVIKMITLDMDHSVSFLI